MQYKWTALTVTFVGTLMAGINTRLVVVGLPTIAKELHTGPDELIWITQSFVLSMTVSTLLVGRVSDMIGRVKIYNVGFGVFTIGSLICSFAANAYQLIAFRAVVGLGAAMVATNSAAIVTDASPARELGTMLGINQAGMRAGAMFGLTLSGLILSVASWQALFYVNVPIGIFGTIWAFFKLREISEKDTGKKMDWPGFGLFTGGLTSVMISITLLSYGLAGELEGIILLVLGVVMLGAFVKAEGKVAAPFIDMSLFKIRLFTAGNLAQMLNAITWTGLTLLIAFYLQLGLGYSVFQAGIGIIPVEVTFLALTVVSGKLSDKYGTRFLSTLGLGVICAAFIVMTTFDASTTYLEVGAILCVLGIGNGLFNSPNNRSIMSSVHANRRGVASAFRGLSYGIGTTVSYGLIILFISIAIPYATFSGLLQGTLSQAVEGVARTEFLNGFRLAAILMAALDAAALVPSMLRGKAIPPKDTAPRDEAATRTET